MPPVTVSPLRIVSVLLPPMIIGAELAEKVTLFTERSCPSAVLVVPGLPSVKKMPEVALGSVATSVVEPLATVQLKPGDVAFQLPP